MNIDREQRIIAMAAKLDKPVEEVRKIYRVMDKMLAEGFDLHEVVEAIAECCKEAETLGLTPEQYIKLHTRYGTA